MPLIKKKKKFQDVKNVKIAFDTEFHIFGSIWESRHALMIMKFSEINESQKDFRLQDISGVKTFFPRSGVHKIAKNAHVERFFNF